MRKIIENHRAVWKSREFKTAVLAGILLFSVSMVVNNIAGSYSAEKASNSVTDIILNNVPVFNVGFILINGSIVIALFIFGLFVDEPKRIPFTLKSLGLFYLIRSLFIIMTHLGPFPEQASLSSNWFWNYLNFGTDLFFSGHTGMPFLMALVFWKNKYLRYIFLLSSLIFGAAVLLGHLHYSIDVFAAFFITYAIYHLSLKFFGKDYGILLGA